MANMLVESLAGDYVPDDYEDDYKQAVDALVNQLDKTTRQPLASSSRNPSRLTAPLRVASLSAIRSKLLLK